MLKIKGFDVLEAEIECFRNFAQAAECFLNYTISYRTCVVSVCQKELSTKAPTLTMYSTFLNMVKSKGLPQIGHG